MYTSNIFELNMNICVCSTVKDFLERYEGKLSKRHGWWEKFIMVIII